MADLQFNEGQEFARSRAVSKPSFLTGLILNTGLAQTERGAQQILLGVAVICIVAALYVAFSSGTSVPPPNPVLLTESVQ